MFALSLTALSFPLLTVPVVETEGMGLEPVTLCRAPEFQSLTEYKLFRGDFAILKSRLTQTSVV